MSLDNIVENKSKKYIDISCFFSDRAWIDSDFDFLNKCLVIDYHLCSINLDSIEKDKKEEVILQFCHWLHDINNLLSPHLNIHISKGDLSKQSFKLIDTETELDVRISLIKRYTSLKVQLYKKKLPLVIDNHSKLINT